MGEQLEDEDESGGRHEDDVEVVDHAQLVEADELLEDALEALHAIHNVSARAHGRTNVRDGRIGWKERDKNKSTLSF